MKEKENYIEDRKGNQWEYIKEQKKENWKIVGSVGHFKGKVINYIENSNKRLPVYRKNSHNKLTHKVVGYLPCGEHRYVEVIRPRIPKKIVVTVSSILVITCIVVGGYWYVQNNNGQSIDSDSKKYETNIKRPEEWGTSRIAIPGYGDIQIEENTDIFNIALYNPEDNPCYFAFSVYLDKSNTKLYQSKLVPPGEAITGAKLNEKIPSGTHDITIKIDTYDLKDQKTAMNGSEVKTRIITYSK